jgi:hypothetical protein
MQEVKNDDLDHHEEALGTGKAVPKAFSYLSGYPLVTELIPQAFRTGHWISVMYSFGSAVDHSPAR